MLSRLSQRAGDQLVDRRVGGHGERADPRGELLHADRVHRFAGVVAQESGQAGDAHERAEQPFAVLGPVLGVRHPAFGDGLGERATGAKRARGGGGRLERRPAGGRETGHAARVEHGDVAVHGARRDGGVVQVALDRHGDDGAIPRGDRRRGERGLAGSGRADQCDRSAIALPPRGPTVRAGGATRSSVASSGPLPCIRPSSIRPCWRHDRSITSGATSRGRLACVGGLPEAGARRRSRVSRRHIHHSPPSTATTSTTATTVHDQYTTGDGSPVAGRPTPPTGLSPVARRRRRGAITETAADRCRR